MTIEIDIAILYGVDDQQIAGEQGILGEREFFGSLSEGMSSIN